MALRSEALCNGKLIGIETIYTVINGKQINIPDKLKALREKSRNGELICPCGCGGRLVLVAGDRNLREQHFRLKDADAEKKCHLVTEGKISIYSKIVLKCWLDEKLNFKDLESRVQICDAADINRKYEFTFFSRSQRVALNYSYDKANLTDEKIELLESNGEGIHIIHVVDSKNGGSNGQYPEGLMKIQEKQGFCLLLSISDIEYDNAMLKAVFYGKNIHGLWEEICLVDDYLKNYQMDPQGSVTHNGVPLSNLMHVKKTEFEHQIESIKQQRLEEEKRRAEEAQRRRDAFKKQQEEAEKNRILKEEEEKRLKQETEEQKKREAEEKLQKEKDFKVNLPVYILQQDEQVIDPNGVRWIKCEFCGKIDCLSEFSSYGGTGRINLGICKDCSSHNPEVKKALDEKARIKTKAYNTNTCPWCGEKLVERNGRNGRFLGCSAFPKCRFTRSIR